MCIEVLLLLHNGRGDLQNQRMSCTAQQATRGARLCIRTNLTNHVFVQKNRRRCWCSCWWALVQGGGQQQKKTAAEASAVVYYYKNNADFWFQLATKQTFFQRHAPPCTCSTAAAPSNPINLNLHLLSKILPRMSFSLLSLANGRSLFCDI